MEIRLNATRQDQRRAGHWPALLRLIGNIHNTDQILVQPDVSETYWGMVDGELFPVDQDEATRAHFRALMEEMEATEAAEASEEYSAEKLTALVEQRSAPPKRAVLWMHFAWAKVTKKRNPGRPLWVGRAPEHRRRMGRA